MEDEGDDEEDEEFSSLSEYQVSHELRQQMIGKQEASDQEEEGELERDIREAQPLQRA